VCSNHLANLFCPFISISAKTRFCPTRTGSEMPSTPMRPYAVLWNLLKDYVVPTLMDPIH
jgi:hypothetical protein